MTNAELAEKILERYTPLAFLCECNGSDLECEQARNATWTQYDTVQRIANFIKSLDE